MARGNPVRYEQAMRPASLCLYVSALLMLALPAVTGCAGRNGVEILEAGAPAPTLAQVAHDGTTIDLGALEGRLALIYFYPRDGTPGCTKEACAFRDVWERYQEAGVLVVGVSSDSDASHAEFAAEHSLPLPLIADEEHRWSTAFGVDTTLGMASRDSFLIGPDGKIAKVYRGVDPGVHADEVLADAKRLTTTP